MDSNHDFRVQSAASYHWTKREFRIVKELVAGERFERPYPDSKSRVLPLDDPASHRKLVAHDGIEPSFPVGKTGGLPLAECAQKHESPRFLSEAQKLRAADCPRYMNVPSPAPCHAKVAGVGKQSVWGLRIIACSSSSLLHHFRNSSIPKSSGRITRSLRRPLPSGWHSIVFLPAAKVNIQHQVDVQPNFSLAATKYCQRSSCDTKSSIPADHLDEASA